MSRRIDALLPFAYVTQNLWQRAAAGQRTLPSTPSLISLLAEEGGAIWLTLPRRRLRRQGRAGTQSHQAARPLQGRARLCRHQAAVRLRHGALPCLENNPRRLSTFAPGPTFP